jgi:hypothetical protein
LLAPKALKSKQFGILQKSVPGIIKLSSVQSTTQLL